jgi:hypothetical protein
MRVAIQSLIVLAAFALTGCGANSPFNPSRGAAEEPKAMVTQQLAAAQGLETLRALVSERNYRGLGFAAPQDARRAHLGEPLAIFRVQLDALKSYRAEENPQNIVVNAHRSLYPVEVDQGVASSLYVTERDGGWRATDFGNAAVARGVTRYRTSRSDFVVWIPALKVYFVARKSSAGLTFTPIIDDPRFGLKAGATLPANRALLRIQREAHGYNGLPQ